METNNDHQLDNAIIGILGIIQDNPLFEFEEFQKALTDPDTVLEI